MTQIKTYGYRPVTALKNGLKEFAKQFKPVKYYTCGTLLDKKTDNHEEEQ